MPPVTLDCDWGVDLEKNPRMLCCFPVDDNALALFLAVEGVFAGVRAGTVELSPIFAGENVQLIYYDKDWKVRKPQAINKAVDMNAKGGEESRCSLERRGEKLDLGTLKGDAVPGPGKSRFPGAFLPHATQEPHRPAVRASLSGDRQATCPTEANFVFNNLKRPLKETHRVTHHITCSMLGWYIGRLPTFMIVRSLCSRHI